MDATTNKDSGSLKIEKLLLTYEEAAYRSGFSRRTLERWVAKGAVPYRRIGVRAVRFHVGDFDKWLAKHRSHRNVS